MKRAFGKLYKIIFSVPEDENLSCRIFLSRIAFSVLTILSCLVVMVSSAYALFRVDVSTHNTTLSGAYYSVSVDKAEDGEYICPLAYEDKHTFVLTAQGTATSGYCRIQIGDKTYYTKPLPQGESLTLTVRAAKNTPITFTPCWGKTDSETCKDEIIHSETPYDVYETEPAAKLADIAEYYGVSEKDILTYNNLTEISAGIKLRIPGVNEKKAAYAVPYATYTVEHTANLEDIAEHYSVLAEDILAFNGIENITVGTELKIPNVPADSEAYSVAYVTYIVEEGVSVEELALYYEVAGEVILAFNGIEELTAGEELKIPGVSADTETYAKADEEPVIPEEQEEEKEEPDVKEDSQEDKSSADKPADQTPPPTGASEDETSSAEEEEQSDEEPVPGDNTSGQSVTDESEEETSSAEVPEGTDEGVSSDMENVKNE